MFDKGCGNDAEIVVPFAVGATWFPDGEQIVYVNWDTDQPADRQRQLYMAQAVGGTTFGFRFAHQQHA